MAEPKPPGPIWSAEYSLGPRPAPTGRDLLCELERAAATKPTEVAPWNAALAALARGDATDDDVGSGAAPPPGPPAAVAVVTAYCREDLAVLRRCHESVLAQTYPCRHVMVADGLPRDEIDGWDVLHVRLDRPHADYGDTPRAAGGERALAEGCDAIAYLDADNAYRPRHVESLVRRHRATGAPVVFSGRTLHFPDGTMLPGVDPADGRTHVDTSCLFLAGPALAMASAWLAYPRPFSPLGDRIFVRMLAGRGLVLACTGALTVKYTVDYPHLYRAMGRPVPPTARGELDFSPVAAYCRTLSAVAWRDLDATLGFPAERFLRAFLGTKAEADDTGHASG